MNASSSNCPSTAIATTRTNHATAFAIGLVEIDADGKVKRPVAGPNEIAVQLLDPWLVGDGRVWERARPRRLRWSLARLAVDEVQALGFGVIRLELNVGDRPDHLLERLGARSVASSLV